MLNLNQIVIINPCLRILGNITHGTDEETQKVVDAGIIDVCHKLMGHNHKIIRMETCWILSNITAGNMKHAEAVVRNEAVLDKLMTLAVSDYPDVQRESVWAVCNATKNCSPEIVMHLLQNG